MKCDNCKRYKNLFKYFNFSQIRTHVMANFHEIMRTFLFVSRDIKTMDGVCIGNWIYCSLVDV
jgi:hypothetical protein